MVITQKTEHYCRTCEQTKPIDQFYKAGPFTQSHCKSCYGAVRNKYPRKPRPKKPPRVTGFNLLPFETRVSIIGALSAPGKKPNCTNIALAHNIKPATLMQWKRNGTIKLEIAPKPIKEAKDINIPAN